MFVPLAMGEFTQRVQSIFSHVFRLASGSDDLDVIVWDWQRRRKVLRYNSGHSANIFQAKFLPFAGDTHIVSTSRDGQVKLTKSSNSPQSRLHSSSLLQVRLAELSATGVCRSTKKLAQHRGPVNKAALIGDSPHCFLTGGEDGVVFHIDVKEPPPHNKLLIQKVCRSAISWVVECMCSAA